MTWGWLEDLFGDDTPAPPDAEATRTAIRSLVTANAVVIGTDTLAIPEALTTVYAAHDHSPRWSPGERKALTALLAEADADGLFDLAKLAETARKSEESLTRLTQARAATDAPETAPDRRPGRIADLDVTLSLGLLRYAEALDGLRVSFDSLHPGTWFAAARDSAVTKAAQSALHHGSAAPLRDAVEAARTRHPEASRLRNRLADLIPHVDLPPIPDGPPLARGEVSVRTPHVRARLAAYGYLDGASGWTESTPFVTDSNVTAALARFERDAGLPVDSILDAETTERLNRDLREVAIQLALNLERWRHLPHDFGAVHVMVNLPEFTLEVREAPEGHKALVMTADETSAGGSAPGAAFKRILQMPANIGGAEKTGWTTPVLTDTIHTIVFQPTWTVPRSLQASQVIPAARADSGATLRRTGFTVYRLNGHPVPPDSIDWQSVQPGQFRFVQRAGPANPLGRVKFLMTNPFAILIHDTNKRYTFDDGAGALSSGCVQAGDAEALAATLLAHTNGWPRERARAAYRSAASRGVQLDTPVPVHFLYMTARIDDEGALRITEDPYDYDAPLAQALELGATSFTPLGGPRKQ